MFEYPYYVIQSTYHILIDTNTTYDIRYTISIAQTQSRLSKNEGYFQSTILEVEVRLTCSYNNLKVEVSPLH